MEVCLGLPQPTRHRFVVDRRRETLDDRGRALVQRPAGRPVRVALDPAVRGIGCVAVDARELERLRVDPDRMAVLVRQVRRPVRDDRVELLAPRRPVGEVGHRPAAAEDPRLVGMGFDVAPDRGQDRLPAADAVERALEALDARRDRVDVGVLEPRQQEPSGQVDHAAVRTDAVGHVARRADGDDPLAPDGDRLRDRPPGVDRVDVAAGEDEVGGAAGGGHRPRGSHTSAERRGAVARPMLRR
jgi:hypothetical protein